jgi:16S rRNA (cytidine1402-2'-O)-methyltransferase
LKAEEYIMILKPGLYIVSTPIGNLEDITIRALNTLKNSTIILCEDTRLSQRLLAKHDFHGKLLVYNDHSSEREREMIRKYIDQGEIISLISDAGTPLVSDPGYKLVRELKEKGYHVDAVVGACSVIAALTLSGLPSDRFLFAGFLPKTIEGRKKIFKELSGIKATLIFFETANRLKDSLLAALDNMGEREACVAREITKLYQETKLESLSKLVEFYTNNQIKGEIVLLISGDKGKMDKELIDKNLERLLKSYLSKGWTAKNATEAAYEKFSEFYNKKDIYKKANELKIRN